MSEFLEVELDTEVDVKTKRRTPNREKQNKITDYNSININSNLGHVDHAELDYENNNIDDHDAINLKINAISLGPGTVLKTTREEAKLSKEEIAKELRLSVRYIEYLEQDAYYKFTAVAFYMGYLRNYARLLDLDSDKLIAKFHAVYKVLPDIVKHKKISVAPNNNLKFKWQEKWPFSLLRNFIENSQTVVQPVKQIQQVQQINSEKSHQFKYLIVLVSAGIAAIILLIWLLFAASERRVNEKQVSMITSLPPERVDELLPTGPVIVKNDDANLDSEIDLAVKTVESESFG